MSIRSGLGAQVGLVKEAAYGTYKAPTRYLPFTGESLSLAKEYVKAKGIKSGRMAQAQQLHQGTTRAGAGDLNFELLDQGMGLIFDLFHEDVVAPTKIGASSAYKQIHQIGALPSWGKSATVQVGRPGTGGTVFPFSYVGCKAITMKISIDASGLTTCVLTLDAQDELEGEPLAAATYNANALPFTFQQMQVLIGAEKIGNVRSMSVEVSVPQKVDLYHLGNTGLKDQPINNDFVVVNGSATLTFATMADHQRFKKEEVVKLSLVGTGAKIDAENNMKAAMILNAAKQVSSQPQVTGPDVLTTDVTFEGLDNGSAVPLEVELISTDNAL